MRAPSLLAATLLLSTAATTTLAQTTRTNQHANIKHAAAHKSVRPAAAAHHEPAGIPAERATQIQAALIKQGYLTGEPSGQWDAQTIAAMTKLQSDNGWQTKITPDSRALIKLGLGPQQPTPAPPPPPQQP